MPLAGLCNLCLGTSLVAKKGQWRSYRFRCAPLSHELSHSYRCTYSTSKLVKSEGHDNTFYKEVWQQWYIWATLGQAFRDIMCEWGTSWISEAGDVFCSLWAEVRSVWDKDYPWLSKECPFPGPSHAVYDLLWALIRGCRHLHISGDLRRVWARHVVSLVE